MRTLRFFLPLLVGALAVTMVQGARVDRIKAAHPTHAKNDVACETCHNAATSKAGTDNLLPTMETCKTCHDVEDAAKCVQCHTNPDEPAVAPRVNAVAQKFPHDLHISRDMKCEACHGETAREEPRIPGMAVCRDCHETGSAQAGCEVCHAASEPLRPASHTTGWVSRHGTNAREDQAECRTCHTESDCQSCHSGDNVRPRTHRLNFMFDHAVDARGNEATCASCHEDRSFCSSCHQANRVMPQNHSRGDWLQSAGDGGRHADEGRLDLESCASCHETGTSAPLCADCHGR